MDKEKIPQYLAGLPVEVPNGNIAVMQPSIKDILAIMSENDYLEVVSMLGNIEKIGMELKQQNSEYFKGKPTFVVFLEYISQDLDSFEKIVKFFSLVFPQLEPFLTNNMILFKIKDGIVGQITPMNYLEFSNIISDLFLPFSKKDKENEYKAANNRAQAIIDKIKKGKEAAQKAQEEKIGSIFASHTSVLSIGLGLDINILFSYTPFQIFNAYNRYQNKQADDYYKRVSSMPMMDTSKITPPKSWLENIYE